jgi:hypothetical protein
LGELALRNLPLAEDDVDFVYGLQSLMAFEDGGVWQRHLDALAYGELQLECPRCGTYLTLSLDGPDRRLDAPGEGAPPTNVIPADPPEDRVGARIFALTRRAGRSELVSKLPYLFGSATCPICRTPFEVPDALT